ncbi:coiled-coil domain-containing protein 178 [Tachyglossus aculeatus]|uniref:coiled-coil domain-containing protein 178 n=1 Tax=Tachyglossus aculeatus TaxID=9261 RepID=UPI0018F48519|nr:coiled-coil domain-containing protein 178 [Tachyglossus aculeatus]
MPKVYSSLQEDGQNISKTDEDILYPTRRQSCSVVNTPSPCVNKTISQLQELETKMEECFQQDEDTLEKEEIPQFSGVEKVKHGEDGWLPVSSDLSDKDRKILALKQETETVLSAAIQLIRCLETDREEAEEALKLEKLRRRKICMKIDFLSFWRLQELPVAVQKEHEACVKDVRELHWHLHTKLRRLEKLRNQVAEVEETNTKIQEDINFMKKHSPLLEEKLQLECTTLEEVELAKNKATELYTVVHKIYEETIKKYQQTTVQAEIERVNMTTELQNGRGKLEYYQTQLDSLKSDWADYSKRITETVQKIQWSEDELKEAEKGRGNVQERETSLHSKVSELKTQLLSQEEKKNNLERTCRNLESAFEKMKTKWNDELLSLQLKHEKTLSVLHKWKEKNSKLALENESLLDAIKESSKKKVEYETEIQYLTKNTAKNEEMTKKVDKEIIHANSLYSESKNKLEEWENKLTDERNKFMALEENMKKLIRDEIGAMLASQTRMRKLQIEHSETEKEIQSRRNVFFKLLEEAKAPLIFLEAEAERGGCIHKENYEKVSDINQKKDKFTEVTKMKKQHLEEKKINLNEQIHETQGKYSVVSGQLDKLMKTIQSVKAKAATVKTSYEVKLKQKANLEKLIEELKKNFEFLNFKKEHGQMVIDQLLSDLESCEERIELEQNTFEKLFQTRQDDLKNIKMAQEDAMGENLRLAQEYQRLQKTFLSEKDHTLNLYDKRLKLESAARDQQKFCVLQSRMNRALEEYFKLRGLYSQAGLAKFQGVSQENAQKILAVQEGLSKTIQHVSAFLHTLTDGSSAEDS